MNIIKLKNIVIFHFEIKNLKLDEIAIGEHANSGAIRYFASSDYENMKNSKSILLKYLKSSIVTKKVCENLFTQNKYKEVFINHGIYVPQGVILDTAKKFNIKPQPGLRLWKMQLLLGVILTIEH